MIKRVVCAISGGVDSTVTAFLLKQRGFYVTGLFMRNWDHLEEHGKDYWNLRDLEDAQKVCAKLDIPLKEVNFVKEYWNEVFVYLIDGYRSGITPNPDIICNRDIKFGHMYEYASEVLEADALATGHYAKNSFGQFLENYQEDKNAKLLRPKDKYKDQTFFLSGIKQDTLQRTMFPLATYTKPEVKRLATSLGFGTVADKAESMGFCFLGRRHFGDLIDEYLEPIEGQFLDVDSSTVIGHHQGIHHYTVGQRVRIRGQSSPYYIVRLNFRTQDITLCRDRLHPALFTEHVETGVPYWIAERPGELADVEGVLKCSFAVQRRLQPLPCSVRYRSDMIKLKLHSKRPVRAVAPGQYVVLYRGDDCLGNAVIENTGPSLAEASQESSTLSFTTGSSLDCTYY